MVNYPCPYHELDGKLSMSIPWTSW